MIKNCCSVTLCLHSIKAKKQVYIRNKWFLQLSLFKETHKSKLFSIICIDKLTQQYIFSKFLNHFSDLNALSRHLREEFLTICSISYEEGNTDVLGCTYISLHNLLFARTKNSSVQKLTIPCCYDKTEFELNISFSCDISFKKMKCESDIKLYHPLKEYLCADSDDHSPLQPIKCCPQVSKDSKRPKFAIKRVDSKMLSRAPGLAFPYNKKYQQINYKTANKNKQGDDEYSRVFKSKAVTKALNPCHNQRISNCRNMSSESSSWQEASSQMEDCRGQLSTTSSIQSNVSLEDAPSDEEVEQEDNSLPYCSSVMQRCKMANAKSLKFWLDAMHVTSTKRSDPYYQLLYNIYAQEYSRAAKLNSVIS